MTVDGVECLACGDRIWSRHRHDMRWCRCGKSFVDGGRAYLRWGGEAKATTIDVPGKGE